ncbi:MAG: hypothetical protein IIC60_00370 [Proteobacteria bacterium]|nr:hypothetical protein [Pseudomonadota bacterium]
MELLLLPALFAICLKIAIFLRYHHSLRRENFNLAMFFIAIFLLNIAELFSIKAQFSEHTLLLILLAYDCCAIFTLHAYVNLALEYSEFNWHTNKIKLALNGILASLIVAMIFSRSIVAGVEPTSYSLTRIAGDMYWVFELYLLGGLLLAVSLLFRGMTHSASNVSRQQCLIVLISTAAPVAVTFAVMLLMAIGVNINSAILMSLAFTASLAMMVFAEEKTRLFRLLTFIPYTKERKFHKQLMEQITECIAINDNPAAEKSLNLKRMMREFEGAVVAHVLGYYAGNQKKTASALGVSEATVSRRTRACARRNAARSYSNDSVRITE